MCKSSRVILIVACVLMWVVPSLGEPGPVFIRDFSIKRSMERAATELINEGETTEQAVLNEQLQRSKAPITAPAPDELHPEDGDLYERACEGVLVIAGVYLCGHCDNHHANCATGFIVSESGLAVTNHHVVESADNLTMIARTRDGRVVPVVEVLASSEADDVALIQLGGEGPFKPLPIARQAKVGQRVHSISHPTGRFYSYSSGEVSRFFMAPKPGGPSVRRVQVTTEFAKGSSGGPIFNDRGQVVGLVTTTNSVYYHEHEDQQQNLQMVFYNCVPYQSILDLFGEEQE